MNRPAWLALEAAAGWCSGPAGWCDECNLVAYRDLLRDCDDEPNGDDEHDDHDATLGDVTLSATAAGAAVRSRDGVFPLWWRPAYVKRHQDERRAAEEKARRERELWLAENAGDGDVYAIAPAPVAHGVAEHVPPPNNEETLALAAVWLLLTDGAGDGLADDVPGFWDPGEAVPGHPDDEAVIASAMSFLLQIREREYA